jgi:hypothetical protein
MLATGIIEVCRRLVARRPGTRDIALAQVDVLTLTGCCESGWCCDYHPLLKLARWLDSNHKSSHLEFVTGLLRY